MFLQEPIDDHHVNSHRLRYRFLGVARQPHTQLLRKIPLSFPWNSCCISCINRKHYASAYCFLPLDVTHRPLYHHPTKQSSCLATESQFRLAGPLSITLTITGIC